MSISFHCTCGKSLMSKEEMAGRKTKCPACGAILTIPGTLVKAAAGAATKSGSSQPVVPHNPDALVVEGLEWSGTEIPTTQSVGTDSIPQRESRPSDAPKPADGSMQYKVLGQKDHSATGKVNLQSLELCLNDNARQGWVLKSTVVISVHSHGSNHDELVLILER